MKVIIGILAIILIVVGAILITRNPKTTIYQQPSPASFNQSLSKPMEIKSPAFQPSQAIPAKYTCDGENVNPPLRFENVPAEAQSLVLIVDDPDAPGGIWTHWLVWNISPQTREIPERSVPREATEGTTSFGQTGWGGPCPPAQTASSGPAPTPPFGGTSGSAGNPHHYRFKLFALSTKLNLPTRTTQNGLEAALRDFVISQAELTGTYRR